MDRIDGKWIAARLTGRHGEKAKIAKAMGIDVQKLSKVLKGIRQVQAHEIPGLMRHFSQGMAESQAAYSTATQIQNLTDNLLSVLKAVAPTARTLTAYTVAHQQLAFGLLKGDILAVDISEPALDGDLVIATATDVQTGDAVTFIARIVGHWLFPAELTEKPMQIGDEGSIAVLGVMRGSIRSDAWRV